MLKHRVPRCSLFANTGIRWEVLRGGQPMTWRNYTKTVTSNLTRVGSVGIADWGPQEPRCVQSSQSVASCYSKSFFYWVDFT